MIVIWFAQAPVVHVLVVVWFNWCYVAYDMNARLVVAGDGCPHFYVRMYVAQGSLFFIVFVFES